MAQSKKREREGFGVGGSSGIRMERGDEKKCNNMHRGTDVRVKSGLKFMQPYFLTAL